MQNFINLNIMFGREENLKEGKCKEKGKKKKIVV